MNQVSSKKWAGKRVTFLWEKGLALSLSEKKSGNKCRQFSGRDLCKGTISLLFTFSQTGLENRISPLYSFTQQMFPEHLLCAGTTTGIRSPVSNKSGHRPWRAPRRWGVRKRTEKYIATNGNGCFKQKNKFFEREQIRVGPGPRSHDGLTKVAWHLKWVLSEERGPSHLKSQRESLQGWGECALRGVRLWGLLVRQETTWELLHGGVPLGKPEDSRPWGPWEAQRPR